MPTDCYCSIDASSSGSSSCDAGSRFASAFVSAAYSAPHSADRRPRPTNRASQPRSRPLSVWPQWAWWCRSAPLSCFPAATRRPSPTHRSRGVVNLGRGDGTNSAGQEKTKIPSTHCTRVEHLPLPRIPDEVLGCGKAAAGGSLSQLLFACNWTGIVRLVPFTARDVVGVSWLLTSDKPSKSSVDEPPVSVNSVHVAKSRHQGNTHQK